MRVILVSMAVSVASSHVPFAQSPVLGPLSVVRLYRGRGMQRDGCTYSAGSCDGLGGVAIAQPASDDMTPAVQLGYSFSIVSGTPPRGFIVPAGPTTSVASEDEIFLSWDDGATDDQETFDFTLAVVAIDLAGNQSAPQMVRIADDPGGSCNTGPRRPSAGWVDAAFALIALGIALARRR